VLHNNSTLRALYSCVSDLLPYKAYKTMPYIRHSPADPDKCNFMLTLTLSTNPDENNIKTCTSGSTHSIIMVSTNKKAVRMIRGCGKGVA